MGNKTGKWEVTNQMLGDTRKYAVVRVINMDEVEHNGNREYTEHGYMEDKAEAEAIAAQPQRRKWTRQSRWKQWWAHPK